MCIRDRQAIVPRKIRTQEVYTLPGSFGTGHSPAPLNLVQQMGRHLIQMCIRDSSKHALRRAAKRQGSIEFAVASVYDLPVADQQIDLLVNCFSPLALEERCV